MRDDIGWFLADYAQGVQNYQPFLRFRKFLLSGPISYGYQQAFDPFDRSDNSNTK